MKKKTSTERAAIGRAPIDVEADRLRAAPWNPRTKVTPESVADLAASISELGLIQRIVVIRDPDGDGYMIVAGHRRLAAWKAAGVAGPVPCELLDCDVETAKRMTLIENLQRADVDPILEADLIAGLVESGMTEAEIAAETGRGEKWVWRRKQLCKLSPSWKEKIDRGCRFTVDCLERIASYSAEVQDEVAETFDENDGDTLTAWSYVSHRFQSRSRDLKDAKFPKNQCTKCPSNSANAPMLFDVEPQQNGKPAKWGTCLCAECFERKSAKMVETAVEAARDTGHEVVEAKHESEIPRSWELTDKPTKEHPVLYVYTDYAGRRKCGYGEAKAKAKEDEDAEAFKEERKREKAERKLKNETCDAIGEWVRTCAKDEVRAVVATESGMVSSMSVDLVMLLMYLLDIGGWEDERIPMKRCAINRWQSALSSEVLPEPLVFDEVWDQYFEDYVTDLDIYATARWYQIFGRQIEQKVPLADEQRELLERNFIGAETDHE